MYLHKKWLLPMSVVLAFCIIVTLWQSKSAVPTHRSNIAPIPSSSDIIVQAKSVQPTTSAIDAKALALLNQSVATYRRLKSYSDTTALQIIQKGKEETSDLSIAFARPSKAAVVWHRQDETVTRRSNGTDYFNFSNKTPGQYLKATMPPISYGSRALLQHQPFGNLFTPFLAGVDPLSAPWGRQPRSLTLATPVVVDGVMCDIVVARYEDESGGSNGETIAYEIQQKDHLLRRIVATSGQPGHSNITVETHRNIKIDPVLPPSTFTFTPPAGTQAVSRLTPPTWSVQLQPGQPAIPLETVDTEGKPFSLSQYKGKPLLMVFWASWCPFCRREQPHVAQAYQKYKAQGLEVVGISLDTDLNRLKQYTTQHNMPWRQLCDGKKWQSDLVKRYGVRSIPFSLLIGRDGKVQAVNLSRLEFETSVAEVLKGSTPGVTKVSASGDGACADCK